MVEEAKSWVRENSTLIYFLIAQLVAIGTAGASLLTYMVRLETRVSIMETRGAEFTVARMEEIKQRITHLEQAYNKNERALEHIQTLPPNIVERITVMEQKINRVEATVERLVQQYFKDRNNRDNKP